MKKLSMDGDVLEGFAGLLNRLSPENLHCDGEITRAQAARRRVVIMREWAALERKAGHEVSEDEVWKNLARRA